MPHKTRKAQKGLTLNFGSGKNLTSKGTTSLNSKIPSLRENVGKSTKQDIKKVGKAIKTSFSKIPKTKAGTPNLNSIAQGKMIREAGGRAALRIAGRLSGVLGAGVAGYEVGSVLNKKLNLSTKIGDVADFALNRNQNSDPTFGGNPNAFRKRTAPTNTTSSAKPKSVSVTNASMPKSESTLSFSEAFRAARKAQGPGGVFVWRGKRFTTDFKEEVEARRKKAPKKTTATKKAPKRAAPPKKKSPIITADEDRFLRKLGIVPDIRR